ncbi:MAG: D-erythronate dehydrogenase [Pseudomonadota bacterium]
MSHVLILGASGMLGRKLVDTISTQACLAMLPVTKLTLADSEKPYLPVASALLIETVSLDVSNADSLVSALASKPDVIFHLAAVVSGEAEADFEKGYRVNLDGTRQLFEAIRYHGSASKPYRPRVVYASSLAVFGGPYPDVLPDSFFATPQNSYGTQKAIGELLLADYSRRGILDGVGLRLPTICIRPGKPNKAASGFLSNILREPLLGKEAVLPVPETLRAWLASPRSAVRNLIHAAALDTNVLGVRRTLNMPGLSVTVAEQLEALQSVAGSKASALIQRAPDPVVESIVSTWPARFEAERALELGFSSEASVADIINVFIEDELSNAYEPPA